MHRGLPLYRLDKGIAVGGIFGSECVAAVLNAEHHERFRAIVAHRATAFGSDAYNAAFTNREHFAVYLKFTFAGEEEVEFLVILVGMKEACLLPGSEYLKGEFAPGGAECLTTEYLAGDFHVCI